MSFNNLIYDTCAYQKNLKQSTGIGNYFLYPGKYNHCKKCRMELGIVGGNAVSIYKGNLVDLESDLKGQTRASSLCPSHKYQPRCKQPCDSGLPSGPIDCNDELLHQPACQMIYYPPTVLPPDIKVAFCPGTYQSSLQRGGCKKPESFCNQCSGYEYERPPKWVPPKRKSCPIPRPAPIPSMCGQKPSCPRCMRPGNMCNCVYGH